MTLKKTPGTRKIRLLWKTRPTRLSPSSLWCGPGIAFLTLTWILTSSLPAQTPGPAVFEPETQCEIIDAALDALRETYIFPEVSEKIALHLHQQLTTERYASPLPLDDFAARLTADLQAISHDGHLVVRRLPPSSAVPDVAPEERERQARAEMRAQNYGFERLERLPGNIGYLDLRYFADARFAAPTAIAAMNFLANTDALIIDLRLNHGGHPSMTQLLTSYFFDKPVHLTDIYSRSENRTRQLWTQASVQGPRLTEMPIYLLTSRRTFSAAEGFSYHLKHLERVTIVGETTGGGAHPVKRHDFSEFGLRLFLPFARAINPTTGTNWEGTGVAPDIKASEEKALDIAQLTALQTLLEASEDETQRLPLRWALDSVTARVEPPPALNEQQRIAYAGAYGPCRIVIDGDGLVFKRGTWADFRLIPITESRFMLDGFYPMRLEIKKPDGRPGPGGELHLLYADGRREMFRKSSAPQKESSPSTHHPSHPSHRQTVTPTYPVDYRKCIF